jgi:hypothetical protein
VKFCLISPNGFSTLMTRTGDTGGKEERSGVLGPGGRAENPSKSRRAIA